MERPRQRSLQREVLIHVSEFRSSSKDPLLRQRSRSLGEEESLCPPINRKGKSMENYLFEKKFQN